MTGPTSTAHEDQHALDTSRLDAARAAYGAAYAAIGNGALAGALARAVREWDEALAEDYRAREAARSGS